MSDADLINWLLENGGSIIRYKTATELATDQTNFDVKKLRSDLLKSEIVQKWIQLKPESKLPGIYALHHSRSSIYENLMNKLIQLGLNSTFKAYDKFAQESLEILRTLINPNNIFFKQFFISLILSFLCRSGYENEALVKQALDRRFNALKDFIQLKNLDFYVDPSEFPRLPKIRRHDIMNPDLYSDGNFRFPFIYDIWAFSRILKSKFYQDRTELIEKIIKRLLTKEYQNLKKGYGIVVESPTKAIGMGWSVHLPFFQSPNQLDFSATSLKIIGNSTPSYFLQLIYLMSHFPSAHKNNWFIACVKRLESYKTEKGTYLLPKSCLTERPSGYWVMGAYLGLGENRRKKNWSEIESTFWMMKIKREIGEF